MRHQRPKYFQEQQKTLLLAVQLTFYLEKSNERVLLVSREGVLHAGTKDIDLKGDIRVKLPREYVLTTETAHYTHSNRIVESETPIRVSGTGLRWTANGGNTTSPTTSPG